MSGKKSRDKGHNWEREIANLFQKYGYKEAKRHLEVQTPECMGFDLDNTDPWLVQCKRHKGYSSVNTIFEIIDIKGKKPVVITKADRKPAMVILTLADFMELIKKTS